MKKTLAIVISLLLLISAGAIVLKYYSFVFSKTLQGEVIGVERVIQSTVIVGSAGAGSAAVGNTTATPTQMYSFAVAIRDEKGVIHSSSSEDRQWSIVQKGQCVEAKFFPYAPWDLEKSGTFYNARLLRMYDCPARP